MSESQAPAQVDHISFDKGDLRGKIETVLYPVPKDIKSHYFWVITSRLVETKELAIVV